MIQDNQREAILLSYLAGIIDGEGTIGMVKQKMGKENCRYNLSIGIGMSDKNTVETFRLMFTPKNKLGIECVPNRKIIYRWRIIGNQKVPKVLKVFLPYLKIKKEHAKLAIEYYEGMSFERTKTGKAHWIIPSELRRRELFYDKFKKLNAVGAPTTTKQEDTQKGEVIV